MLGLNALHRTLLRMEPEAAHLAAMRFLRLSQSVRIPLGLLRSRCAADDPRLEQRIWGHRFSNPIGLAAGFDKNGEAVRALAALGFGYLEAGTVTPLPQRGNPKPRVFRHSSQQSLQNALGFNNSGADSMARRLERQRPYPVPLGVNIGKNRRTPLPKAVDDYQALVERLQGLCDYLVINVSSPNTPGLRDMQKVDTVADLLRRSGERTSKPLLIKLSPDLEDGEAIELCWTAREAGAAGVVITNTTADYSLLPEASPVGGLSGRVLRRRSFEMLQLLDRELRGRLILISVGGIDSPAEVYARLKAGARLVQIYTAIIFQGPLVVRNLLHGLLELMERDGVERIEDLTQSGA